MWRSPGPTEQNTLEKLKMKIEVCVYVLRNEYLCRLLRKTGFVNFRVLNFICHTNEDSFWHPMTSQRVYKELLNLKNQL